MARSRELTSEFIKFGLVGTLGFGVDTAVLYLGLYVGGLGFYSARLISFLTGATFTWAMNRTFTFRYDHGGRPYRQWSQFVLVNSIGGAVNYGTYVLLISYGAPFTDYPVLAVAAGSIAGLAFNFTLSKVFVFRQA